MAPNDPKMTQKLQKSAWNGLNVFKLTSETISIRILPLLRSFWVVTWLVCDKFEFGDKNGPKLPRNGQKWPKIVRNGQKWLLSLKKTRIDLVYVTSGPFWSLLRMFLRKMHFCVHPFQPQNDHFWSPEGPFLAKNLENIVFSVHTIQNFPICNPNVAPKKVTIFAPRDPTIPPRDPPQGSGGAKNGQNAFPQVQ